MEESARPECWLGICCMCEHTVQYVVHDRTWGQPHNALEWRAEWRQVPGQGSWGKGGKDRRVERKEEGGRGGGVCGKEKEEKRWRMRKLDWCTSRTTCACRIVLTLWALHTTTLHPLSPSIFCLRKDTDCSTGKSIYTEHSSTSTCIFWKCHSTLTIICIDWLGTETFCKKFNFVQSTNWHVQSSALHWLANARCTDSRWWKSLKIINKTWEETIWKWMHKWKVCVNCHIGIAWIYSWT